MLSAVRRSQAAFQLCVQGVTEPRQCLVSALAVSRLTGLGSLSPRLLGCWPAVLQGPGQPVSSLPGTSELVRWSGSARPTQPVSGLPLTCRPPGSGSLRAVQEILICSLSCRRLRSLQEGLFWACDSRAVCMFKAGSRRLTSGFSPKSFFHAPQCQDKVCTSRPAELVQVQPQWPACSFAGRAPRASPSSQLIGS